MENFEILTSELFRAESYDREIDEGMSSGLQRLIDIDLTNAQDYLTRVLNHVKGPLLNQGLFKYVQLTNYLFKGKNYLAVSGETHKRHEREASRIFLKYMTILTDDLPVSYLENGPELPVHKDYQKINLGPYGTTGCPGKGIPMHLDAKRLREEGKIM